jgi:pyruvate dehydrogenase E2 component (dihydrolipoamide acetyltransferase)
MSDPQQLSRMRKAIVKAMTQSATIPQFGLEMDVDVAALTATREAVDAPGRPSVVDALIASSAQALTDHPEVNASFTEEGIVRHEEVNVAFALALDEGLISPAIRNADRLSIDGIAAERRRLTKAARAGALTPEEILSATFTISNLGPFGVRRFNALIVPPQAAILAVGGIVGGLLSLTLTVDHRPLDGAPAAAFLTQVRAQLEDPDWLSQVFVTGADAS